MQRIWNFLGDMRLAVVLLLMAAAILLTGTWYAGRNYALFAELNRLRIQEWLVVHWGAQTGLIWWIPVLFAVMGALGLNTFVCASNRVARIVVQRRALSTGRFLYLLMPSLIHGMFIVIMLGHLTTFTAGKWQTLTLETGMTVPMETNRSAYRVLSIDDRFFSGPSALSDQIAQTTVTFSDAGQKNLQLQYGRPIFDDGHFYFLDKVNKKKTPKIRIPLSKTDETCNKAEVYREPDKVQRQGDQLLLIVSDPGLVVILGGLILILGLMGAYFFIQTVTGKQNTD